MPQLHIRVFTLSMSLLIAFAQCGVGINSLLCFCTGEKSVALYAEAGDPCGAGEICTDEEESCCAGACSEDKDEATDAVCLDKLPCSARTYEYVQSPAIGFIPAFHWALSLDWIAADLPDFYFINPAAVLQESVSVLADRGPPFGLDTGRFLSLIQSYLL